MFKISKEALKRAETETAKGREEYSTGKKAIEKIIQDVNNGKISGDLSKDLLSVFATNIPLLEKANKYFEYCSELIKSANREFDNVTEETSARINKNRI